MFCVFLMRYFYVFVFIRHIYTVYFPVNKDLSLGET